VPASLAKQALLVLLVPLVQQAPQVLQAWPLQVLSAWVALAGLELPASPVLLASLLQVLPASPAVPVLEGPWALQLQVLIW
jgi:hypothetical protein